MTSSKQDPGEPLDQDTAAGSSTGADTELYTLGPVRLIEQGSEQTSKLGPKHLALLLYLAHERRSIHPTEVTELLGRGQEEDKEIAALRRAVGWLSDNVPGVNIRMSAGSIEPIGGVWVDSAEVDGAIDRGDPRSVEQLYVGEFLEGFESGSSAFDEWAKKERGRVKRAWTHAMLSASRRAEEDDDWIVAAQWWQLLVARAPMRPEGVASLLRAFMKSGQEDKATTAYFSYAALLAESGISQPADAVKEVLGEYPALQETTGVRVELPVRPEVEEPEESEESVEPETIAAEGDEEVVEVTEPAVEQEHTFESLSAALDAEFEAEFDIGSRPADAETETFEEEEAVAELAEPEAETSVPEPSWPEDEFGPHDEETGEELWRDVVDLASNDEIAADLSGELPKDAAEDELETPPPDPIVALDDEGGEIFQTDHEIMAEEDVAEVTAGAASPAAADLRETPYDRGAAYLDAQPEIAADEGGDESDAPGTTGASAVGSADRALFGLPRALGRKIGTLAGSAVSGRSALARLRHYWYVPLALGVAALAFALGPKFLVTVGDLAEDLPEVNTPALPRVNLPKVTVKAPGFVETSVSRIGELLSGPILEESGRWVLVADFQLETPSELAPIEGETGGEEPATAESVPAEGREIDPVAVTDTSPSPGSQDSATTVEDDTTRVHNSVPLVSVSLGLKALGNSDDGAPGTGLALPENSIGAGESSLRASAAALGDTVPPVRQDSVPPVEQDTTPPAQPDTIPDTTGVVDSSAIADTSQSVGTDSIPEEAHDTTLALPTPVAAAEDSVAHPEAEPQERLSLAALTTVVEADLDQAEFFSVVPRERALNALQSLEGGTSEALPVEAALQLAGSEGWEAVISGRVKLAAEVDSLKLLVLNAAGDTLYGVAAEVTSQETALETLAELTRAIRRRLGEPGEEVEASPTVAEVLSPRHAALNAYSEARADLYAGRLPQAVGAAREAVESDTTFVLAYLMLADAYAQSGVRASGRSALEQAWSLSGLATERDSMRIHADRLAWEGLYSEAVVTYDDLFQRYRDDVMALKSQALLQRMIGARGGGEGNLRVAYTIDPYDWPRLSRIARYLGYTGTLPDVDSLVASLQEPPTEESPADEPPSEVEPSEG